MFYYDTNCQTRDLTHLHVHTSSWVVCPVSKHFSLFHHHQLAYMCNWDKQCNLAWEELSNQTQGAKKLTLKDCFIMK